MKKSELRALYLQKRKTLSQDEVLSFSNEIFLNFIKTFQPKSGEKVHIFISIEKFNEVDTIIFIKYFFENGIRVFVPKMVNNRIISIEISSQTVWEQNSWGIKEPKTNEDSSEKDFDFVITPLLYCDHHGNRVGYGKGFYDGFFENLEKEVKKIGVNFFPPKENVEDVFHKDVPVDYLVTPIEVLSFGISE